MKVLALLVLIDQDLNRRKFTIFAKAIADSFRQTSGLMDGSGKAFIPLSEEVVEETSLDLNNAARTAMAQCPMVIAPYGLENSTVLI